MRRHLLPLGLAALLCNPSFAQSYMPGRADLDENNPAGLTRQSEAATPLSLKAALHLAFAANAELAGARRELEAQAATIIQARARPNPEFSSLMEGAPRATRTTTMQFNQPIELGGKRAARIDAAERGRDLALAELSAKQAEIRANVLAAFFDVRVAEERLRLAQGSLELAQRANAAATRRVLAGKVSPVEETKARVAEAGVRLELAQAHSELSLARQRLTAIWGNPSPRFARSEGDVDAVPALPALADLQQRLAASPTLLRAKIEVERRQALSEIERSRQVPDVTLSLGSKRNAENGLSQAVFGLSLPLPLFDRNQGNLLEALHRTDKARDELATVEIRLTNELSHAHARLSSAQRETTTLRQEILPGAQSAYDAATKGFELGKFGFLDVLDAQRTSLQAKSQYLRALAEAHRAAADIERILGASTFQENP